MANLASLTWEIPNSNNNWKWVLMTKDEYLLTLCCQHGYGPNSKAEVKLGKDSGNISDRPNVQPASLYKPPETESLAQIHNAETKHNMASTNYTHFAHTNLACVLDIINALSDAIFSHLFSDDEHANQASALEIL